MVHVERIPAMKIRIDSIKISKRFRKELGNVQALADNIKQVGELLQPIVIDSKRNLICGERRLRACKLLKWTTIPARVLDLENPAFAESSENAESIRLPFTMSEKVAIAQALAVEEKRKARERQLAGKKIEGEEKGQSRDKVAALLGVSQKHLERARQVVQIAKDFPKDKEAQEALVLLDQPKGVAKAWMKSARVKRLANLKRVVLPCDVVIHQKDFRKVEWEENSLDLVYTDPPWADWKLYEDVAKVAAKALKPDRFCMVYTGTTFLAKVLELMTRHLTFVWQFIINYDGSLSTMVQCGVMRRYTSVLVFCKGNKGPQHHHDDRLRGFDTYKVDSSMNKHSRTEFHKWQQDLSPAAYWIEASTQRGDIVADFCLGSGTFGVAAKGLDRRFVGCDPDPVAIRTARHRIATEVLPQRTERGMAS